VTLRRAFLIALCIIVICSALLVLAWWQTGFKLQNASAIGDAAAPIVGIFSLLAIGGAIWSIRLQIDALSLQAEAVSQQHRALGLQAEDLKKQQAALEAQMTAQRHGSLRDAYSRLLAATNAYHDAVEEYRQWITANHGDRRVREQQQAPIRDTHDEMVRAIWAAQLVDTDRARDELRFAMTRRIVVEPKVDRADTHRAYAARIRLELFRRKETMRSLIISLTREFGGEVRMGTDEEIRAEAQLKEDIERAAEGVE